MKAECPSQQLVAYLDGELEDAERQQLERHLAGCNACRQRLDELRRAVAGATTLPAPEPSPGFRREFWERFAREQQKHLGNRLAEWLPRWPLWVAGGALAAGTLVAVLLTGAPHASDSDKLIASHLELFSDYEVISNLDILEDLEVIEALDGDA